MLIGLMKNASVKNTILAVFTIIFIVGVAINLYISSSKMKEDAIRSAVAQGRILTQGLDVVRKKSTELFEQDFYDLDALFSNPHKLNLATPILQSLEIGVGLAEIAGFTFRTPAFDPRNPKNEPTLFESVMLNKIASEDLVEHWAINEASNELYFMRTVKLDETCMMCHGNIEQSVTGTPIDPLGFHMEGWKVGDRHGAFEFIIPLSGVDQAVTNAAITSGALIRSIVLVAIVLLILLLSVIFTKPINAMVRGMERLANRDLSLDVNLNTNDEIGLMAKSFNSARKSINNLIFEVRTNIEQIASAVTEIAAAAEQSANGAGDQES